MDDIANNIMVLIVKVKLGQIVLRIAIKQLMDYLLSMQKKINQDPSDPLFNRDIRGLLVIGDDLHILYLRVNGSQGFAGPYIYRDGYLTGSGAIEFSAIPHLGITIRTLCICPHATLFISKVVNHRGLFEHAGF